MSNGPTFEQYLASKRIDSDRFKGTDPELWQSWKTEFDQMHPNSFTIQKLNLINPIRRKYRLMVVAEEKKESEAPSPPAIKPGRPIIRPKGPAS